MSEPMTESLEEFKRGQSIRISDSPNPMHSRCGLTDCDCGYVIEEVLLPALEKIENVTVDFPTISAAGEIKSIAHAAIKQAKGE